jgi:hypothetical protein
LFWLIALLVVVWLVVMGFLAVWTLFFQGYVYTEPVKGIAWRAPVAGTLVTLTLVLWVSLDYSTDRYGDLWKFNPTSTTTFKELVVVTRQEPRKSYTYTLDPAGKNYVRSDGSKLPDRPLKVTVKEGGEEVIFEPDRDPKTGNFKPAADGSLYYHDKKGQAMREDQVGSLNTFSTGNLVGYLLLNLLFFAAWFLVMWRLLDYRMGHALGLAVVFYLVVVLLLLPPMLSYTERVAQERRLRTGGPAAVPAAEEGGKVPAPR